MTRTFSYALPSSMYEVFPDYGMITQAWNIYSFAIPIIQQFFGINPKAHKKTVVVSPQMPSTWKKASVQNVYVVNNRLDVAYTEEGEKLTILVNQLQPDWTIEIRFSKTKAGKKVKIESITGEIKRNFNRHVITSTGKKLMVAFNYTP